MLLPGLLIEYLISGALSLIWIYPLATKFQLLSKIGLTLDGALSALALTACLYFIGMTIDMVAWALTKQHKNKSVRSGVLKKYFNGKQIGKSSLFREVSLVIYAPELAKEFAMRSSRDRVARGAIVNSIIATFVYSITSSSVLLSLLIGMPATVVCFLMWRGFEKISYGFEINAEKILNLKHPESKQQQFL